MHVHQAMLSGVAAGEATRLLTYLNGLELAVPVDSRAVPICAGAPCG